MIGRESWLSLRQSRAAFIWHRNFDMRNMFIGAAVAAISFAATPALADIKIYDTPGALQPDENVLFQSDDPMGSTAFGETNNTTTGVTFVGIEALLTPSMGQARIEAADGGLSELEFFLTDPLLLGFTEVEFNIFGTRGSADSVDLQFTDQFNNVFTQTSVIVNGQNFFSAEAIDGQVITNVSFVLNGDVVDVQQFRIGGITPVPEPSSWALMMLGVGLTGAAMRKRPLKAVTA